MRQVIDTKFKLTNGLKSINPWDLDDSPEAWIPLNNEQKSIASILVPPYYAAKQARCKAVADLPFSIYNKAGKEVDNSDEYKNVLKFMPNPREFFGLTEASLIDYGRAYWFKKENPSKYVKGFQYFTPETIEPKYDSQLGLVGFERRNGTNKVVYKPEEILYFWLPDPSVELGPPKSYPFSSAILSAFGLEKINSFIADYMHRGAVKAMMLAAKGMPSPEEAERVETWFNKFMRGVNNLRWKVFNSDAITPTIVGEGLEAFKGISVIDDLTQQIHTAMGTRHLLEDANYATAQVRQSEFVLNTVVPEAKFMGDVLNMQILNAMGYYIEFDPSRLEIFQADESEHMTAFGTLSQSMTNSSPEVIELAISLAGIVLTEEQQKMLDDIKAKKEEEKAEMDKQMEEKQTMQEDVVEDDAEEPVKSIEPSKYDDHIEKWMRKACKRVGKDVPFLSDEIPQEEQDRIHQALPECKTVEDIKKVFESINQVIDTPEVQEFATIANEEYKAVLDKLRKGLKQKHDIFNESLIEGMRLEVAAIKGTQQPSITIHNHPGEPPIVNIEAAKTPDVTVNVPEQPAPVINVEVKENKPPESEEVIKAIRKLSNG